MGKIVLLDDSTINKIAAGEVIERPASVVKELMENSIDAGATKITVEIRNGGISYIRITDNGKGIAEDDLEIAFERHATSKLRSADDLDNIKSMGFRGEALASIASIAKVQLISKTEDSDIGNEIMVEGGKILVKQPAGCPKGTSITIENLFFNTPVRYKFLKKDFTESGYIEDVVTRIALVNTNIAIKLINAGKTVIQTSGNGDLKSVIYNIYGKEIAENLLNINYTYEGINITGVVGKPVISRSNRANQLFFVNRRFIKDKTLTGAADQGFKGFITIGKHGFLVLNLDMDPRKVDVNVHPAKLEVRFQEENIIFKAVYHAIREALLTGDLVADTNSIDEIDKEKTRYSDSVIETNPVLQTNDTTKFRDIINKSKLEEESSTYSTIAEEKKDEESFEDVMNKLQRMQNMIKIAKMQNGIKDDDKVQNTEEKLETEENNLLSKKVDEFLDTSKETEKESIEKTKNEEMEKIKENTLNKIQDILDKYGPQKKDESKGENKEAEEEKQALANQIKEEIKQDITQISKTEGIKSEPEFLEMYEKTFGIAVKKKEENTEKDIDVSKEFKPITGENVSVFENESKYATKPAYKLVGIAFKTYIIIEIKDDLYIIDQHAAHERIMYEKIKKNYYSSSDKNSQLMLLPDIITLTHKEMSIYRDNVEMFKKAGFMVEEFGENTVKLSGVPDVLLELETKELFLEALDEINTVARTAKQEIEEKFIATVACKAAVKAHMALSNDEVVQLLDKLLILPNPFTCPHGRPTAIKMTRNDIEKKFSRR